MDPKRPLVLTADESLLDDLLRLVAAAGCEADVARDAGLVRARWRSAPLVLLGADRLAAAHRARLPRREGVLLVGRHAPEPTAWSSAVDVGVARVLTLPDAEGALVDLLADTAERAITPGYVVAVVGGRGGAGASVLATGLAVTAARGGCDVLLLDADPLGGGLDLVLGVEAHPGLRWPDLAAASGRLSAAALHQALPSAYGVSILSHQRGRACEPGPEAMIAVAQTGQRAGDLVVVDLARDGTPGQAALAGLADLVLLVVPAEVRACAAAGRVAELLALSTTAISVVVRTPSPAGVTPEVVSANLGLPVAGVLRREPGLPAALERGEAPARRGRGPLASLCRSLLQERRGVPGRRAA